MNFEGLLFLILGGAFLFVGVKQFVFFLRGGGIAWDLSKPGGHPSRAVAKPTSSESIQMLLYAVLFVLIGGALWYMVLFPLK